MSGSPARSPAILAYRERESLNPETGEPGILRDEWRIRHRDAVGCAVVRAAVGHDNGAPYVLEHRYIRRGTPEPWAVLTIATDPLELMSYVDGRAVPVDAVFADYCRARDEQRAREEARRKAVEAERRERERQRERLELSADAFRRMMRGAPRNRELAARWSAHVTRLAPRAQELLTNAAFRATYDAVLDATTVPSKARAIRAHLAKWDSLATAPETEVRP